MLTFQHFKTSSSLEVDPHCFSSPAKSKAYYMECELRFETFFPKIDGGNIGTYV